MQGAAAIMDQAFSAQRRAMVDGQIRTFAVTDAAVIAAFSAVPRELFLPEGLRGLAYSDAILTLPGGAAGRALLQPMVLARLMQGAMIEPTARALVVGGGNGYAACILARIAASVVTLDTDPAWATSAEGLARNLGLAAVRAVSGDLVKGFPEGAPYDVIVVQGAVEVRLDALLGQLAPGGRLVAIEGHRGDASRRAGKAVAFRRAGDDVSVRPLFDATVPVLDEFRRPPAFVF